MVLNNAEQKLTWFLLTRIESIRVNYHLALISCNKVCIFSMGLFIGVFKQPQKSELYRSGIEVWALLVNQTGGELH